MVNSIFRDDCKAKNWDYEALKQKGFFIKPTPVTANIACTNCKHLVSSYYLPLHQDKCYNNGIGTLRLCKDLRIPIDTGSLNIGKFSPEVKYFCPRCKEVSGNFCHILTHYENEHRMINCVENITCLHCPQVFAVSGQGTLNDWRERFCMHICNHLMSLKSVDAQIEEFLELAEKALQKRSPHSNMFTCPIDARCAIGKSSLEDNHLPKVHCVLICKMYLHHSGHASVLKTLDPHFNKKFKVLLEDLQDLFHQVEHSNCYIITKF